MGKTLAMLILTGMLLAGYWWLLHDVSRTVSEIQNQMEIKEKMLQKIK